MLNKKKLGRGEKATYRKYIEASFFRSTGTGSCAMHLFQSLNFVKHNRYLLKEISLMKI
jgi:hypothetical protein